MNVSYDKSSVDLLTELHWLPVKARVMFKVLVILFRVIMCTAPSYLKIIVDPIRQGYRLRSQNELSRRTKLADRSKVVTGPKWWNDLPNYLKDIKSETRFRAHLKTYLYRKFHRQ